ncbi:MocR-like pyridoxine biosynthesis transcription factor PdxR [Novispirillum itersonii]|uniref:MocR-like pyridoxine biosynthesis transcription factor PdxR n=1 Tax=Novispirillum itersonii TaxID=189 RepID=UPI000361A3AE|nr:PLP-dependent aminotransferase family protein [Novispirillum itersonii]
MQTFPFDLSQAPGQRRPVFLRLCDAIIAAITDGRLKPGDRLPGSRALAAELGLHRNTVDAAFREAIAQGWLTPSPSRGTFVTATLPDHAPAAPARPPVRPKPPGTPAVLLHLSDGVPDPRLMPAADFARAFRRALSGSSGYGDGYGDPRGLPQLRGALSRLLATERGLSPGAFDLLVTRGSQMALYLAAVAAMPPGITGNGAIAVEDPGYPQAAAAFRAAGARVLPVPVDSGGIDLTALEALAASGAGLRAVYVTPHHQYPTTVTLGAERRLRLLDLAARHGLILIEDDYDHDYRFDGTPVLPLAARCRPGGDGLPGGGAVIYVGSLSKVLAPTLRLGYAAAPPALLRVMAERRDAIDRQGDTPLEAAVARLIEDGDLARHTRKARRIYQARRDHMTAALTAALGHALQIHSPAGGLALWATITDGSDADRWATAAARLGLAVRPGSSFAVIPGTPSPQAFRIGFAALTEAEAGQAVALLAQAHRMLA